MRAEGRELAPTIVLPVPAARRILARLAAPALVFGLMLGFCLWYLAASPLRRVEGFSAGAVVTGRLIGFHGPETTAGGGMRWTRGLATIALPTPGLGAQILDLRLSAPRPDPVAVPVSVSLNGAAPLHFEAGPELRRYSLLLSGEAVGLRQNSIALDSPTFAPGAGDRRTLGVALFTAGWRSAAGQGWLPVAQATAIAAAATALFALTRRAGIPLVANLVAVLLYVAILISMRHSDLRFVYRLNALGLTAGLALLTALALPFVRPQAGDGPLPWERWANLHWPALAGFVALTALMHWPLVTRMATEVPGIPGDAYEYVWKVALFEDYLVERHQSPAFVPDLMYPEGLELANSELSPANNLVGLPVTALLGPVVSYNTQILLSYVLSGFCAYLLIHRLGARRLAAFVGALAFAFTLRRFYQMQGHLPHMPTQYIALAVYGLEGLITRRRNWDGFVTGVSLAMMTWASLLFGSTLTLFLVGYALLRIGLRPLPAWVRSAWRPLLVGALLLLCLVAPFAQPYLELRTQGVALRHDRIHLEIHAARPEDYLQPNPYHPLFGQWALQFQRNDGGEHVVIVGYSVIALAALGLWRARPRRLAVALAVLSAGAFVLSLGPFLYLPGGARLPLPVLFIYEHVPVLNGIRVWNRVVLYLVLCAAVLAGLALTTLRGRRYVVLSVVAGAVLLFELAAVGGHTRPAPRAVDLWLAARPDRSAAIELPVMLTGSSVFYASYQGRPSSVWYGTFPPPLYAEGQGMLLSFPSQRAVNLLERWGVRYIIVNEASMATIDPAWRDELATLAEPMYSEGGYSVYAIERAGAPTASGP